MRIGRLRIDKPIWGFFADKGACGCLFLWTPLASFTWLDKECKCSYCGGYTCVCAYMICAYCAEDPCTCIIDFDDEGGGE